MASGKALEGGNASTDSVSVAQSPSASTDPYDTPEDRALLRKIDINLLPVLTTLYLLSFLDRSNIGNAKYQDINVIGANYNTSLALYFVGYVLFEIPANVTIPRSLKRFNPRIWLPLLTLTWGIVSVCQGLIHNQAGLFAVRFFLGVTEAGLCTKCIHRTIFVFSMYYRRSERHFRVAIFFGGAAVAGAFGGALAYGIGRMDGVGGKRGWAWIFILEGLLTIVISLFAFFITPDWSHSASFLTEKERARLLERLSADSDAGQQESFRWDLVRSALTDHLVWAYAFLFHGFAFVLYSLSLFLPSIIAGLGFASWKAQLMTVPPYAVAAASIWIVAVIAARYKRRAVFIILSALVGILGYIILIATKTAGRQYVGVFLAAAGVYTGNALLLSWPGENVSGQTKRAVAVAMQISIGDIGAIAGVLVYRPSLSAHRFRTPHIISIGYLVFGALVAAYLWAAMARQNRLRAAARQSADANLAEKQPSSYDDSEERLIQGDRHISYTYQV
ncbi:MFS general substrate transporter [Auricularia subglabra TFB-10046 SS5]|uniref:MFS general substrate transporter n=1 Tax=Auricularia subglabra (strain TFB-10046 / SS5) TaxID=717982 RepID=J0DCZ2_AURST|nr:MFS general substrate transporter [Auricularia subglabra TFB-10046 SS5]